MKSNLVHQFSQVPKAEIQRSSFDRTHGVKTAFNAGDLIPILIDEALPGDTYNVNMTAFARMATPIHPIMDNLFMDTFFFAVPYRLVWDNWQKFNGEQTDPGDSTDFLVPQITADGGGFDEESIFDYMGVPTKVAGLKINALHNRAINLIWNEWFRDQNLQDSLEVYTDDGPDLETEYSILKRGKRHDYFTSCLPWPQKGDSIDLPLGTTAPVLTDAAQTSYSTMYVDAGGEINPGATETVDTLYADLSTATAATINQLRQAFQVQKLLERDARGGTRYIEIIKAHFGVTSPDARLQRPEYLGGSSTPVNITPIAQTSSTDATTPQGNLSAIGTTALRNNGFSKSFTEHNLIIGLVSVRADLNYQQGLNKMWSRQTRYDYYWPALSHIGEQAVLNKEIYADGSANDDLVFGYQERYAEYRYKPSTITGVMRSNHSVPLDAWHLAQEFGTLPVLDSDFIEEDPPIARVIAVNTEPHFIFDALIKMNCARPMPMYSTPGLIDHF